MKRKNFLTTTLIAVTLMAVVIALVAYSLQPAKFYTADQIHVSDLRVNKEGIDVEFTTFGETLYTCPGVSIDRSGDVIDLYFHRGGINRNDTKCEIPSVIEPDGKCSVNVPIEFSTGTLRINGTKTVYSKGK